jgi:hypothetical protein
VDAALENGEPFLVGLAGEGGVYRHFPFLHGIPGNGHSAPKLVDVPKKRIAPGSHPHKAVPLRRDIGRFQIDLGVKNNGCRALLANPNADINSSRSTVTWSGKRSTLFDGAKLEIFRACPSRWQRQRIVNTWLVVDDYEYALYQKGRLTTFRLNGYWLRKFRKSMKSKFSKEDAMRLFACLL